ncbi:MAG: hypothetical protein H0W83_12090 [Planctomycetes bacterium]|nr:hypothetical protein [Planctomycetota bacterium]
MISTAIASDLLPAGLAAAEPTNPVRSLVGFYLHACWDFAYPYAVRSWSPDDYRGMFRLLRRLDFDTVMLWPVVEAIPMPLSAADRADLQHFRSTIADAQAAGLRCWLTQCAALGCDPAIAAKPWLERNFYPARRIVRLDDAAQRQDYFAHRAAIMGELNNADAYVTIDGDPGGYAGARPGDFVDIFRADRATIARVGSHPREQQVIPWLWAGWGTAGVWTESVAPYLAASAAALAAARPELEPFSVLPGRNFTIEHHNRRHCLEAVARHGLAAAAVTFLYQAIEFEPIPPAIEPAFDRIRTMMHQEAAGIRAGRGVFGNAQQPLLQLPNLWFFARAARDPAYLDRPDATVFADLAAFLGGDPTLLSPAWRSLRAELAELPPDLPQRLRAARLGPAADDLPGGGARYLDLLARQVECRRACLLASATSPADAENGDTDAVARCVAGCAAIIAWWQDNRYVFDGADGVGFRWHHVHEGLRCEFDAWVQRNQKRLRHQRPAILAGLAGVLPAEQLAARVTDLLGAP